MPEQVSTAATFRENADGTLVCPHRDLSVCPTCAQHPDVVEVAGAHYADPTGVIRAALAGGG